MAISLFHFGADATYKELERRGFRRRNAYILKSLAECGAYRVVSVHRTYWKRWLSLVLYQQKESPQPVQDVFIASLLPETNAILKQLNSWLFWVQLFLQTGRLKPGLCWAYWPTAYQLAQRIYPHLPTVFDLDHNIVEDENQSGQASRIKHIIEQAPASSTLFVAASSSMLAYVSALNKPYTYRLRNGIELNRFKNWDTVKPGSFPELARLRVGYVGMLSQWMDWPLLYSLAEALPQVNFEVVGSPAYEEISNKLPGNVNCLGFKDSTELPQLMRNWHIGLCLYRKAEWMDTDSMKIYEYLATGLPVLSTVYYPAIQADYQHVLEIFNQPEEFTETLMRLARRTHSEWESWQHRRTSLLSQSSWEQQLLKALPVITTFLNHGR